MQHHPTLLNSTCCTRLATMLPDVGWCWSTFDFHQTSSSTSSNISLVFKCEQKCCVRFSGHFVQHCWTCACPLSWLWVICFDGNGSLFVLASNIPRGCKDTVWRMRKVFNHSPEKVQAISPQIEKDRAKQPLENRKMWNQENGADAEVD